MSIEPKKLIGIFGVPAFANMVGVEQNDARVMLSRNSIAGWRLYDIAVKGEHVLKEHNIDDRDLLLLIRNAYFERQRSRRKTTRKLRKHEA